MPVRPFHEYLDIDVSSVKTKTFYTNITNMMQNTVTRSNFQAGIVLVHTLHTTTGLTAPKEKIDGFTAFLVNEDEPLLMEDISCLLDAGAKKILGLLPYILKNRKKLADIFPDKILDDALEIMMSCLKPANGYKHDDFEVRVANMGPNERKNAEAHLKASLLKESIRWTFSHGLLNIGPWQSFFFFDFDPMGRKKRKLSILLIGE